MNLKNQRVVVIGGTAGIGFAVAKLAIEEGASVVVASGTQQRVGLAIKQLGTEAEGRVLSVLQRGSSRQIGESLPAGRVGEPSEVAEAYIYLMKNRFSTGSIVVTDGGRVLV